MRSRPALRWRALVLACLTAAGCARSSPGSSAAVTLPKPAFPIVGEDSAGGVFRMSEQRGHVVVLSFGFTSCPDVCPTTLAKARSLVNRLGDRAAEVTVAFVTVDPERDSPARLKSYVRGFDPGFHGVYVERERLKPLLDAYDVVAIRREYDSSRTVDPTARYYAFDHTGGFQIVDKAGQVQARLPPSVTVESLAETVGHWLGPPGPSAGDAPSVHVVAPRARIPAGSTVGAVYFRVQSDEALPDRLLSVASPDAERAEIHEMLDDHGVVRMVAHPEGVVVQPRAALELSEGGMHVMLLGLSRRDPTAPVSLRLEFERAGSVSVQAPVQAVTAD